VGISQGHLLIPFSVFGFWFSVKRTRVLNKLQVMLVALARESGIRGGALIDQEVFQGSRERFGSPIFLGRGGGHGD
jgi:hypothetical protein